MNERSCVLQVAVDNLAKAASFTARSVLAVAEQLGLQCLQDPRG